MKLGVLAKELSNSVGDDDKTIDFGAAGLYLPAAQTVFATTFAAIVSVLANWIIPVGAISAIRTLALTATSGILIIRRPLRIGHTKGVTVIFSALRPCCILYVSCLVLEQLVHTCVSDESSYEHGFYRRVIYHACMAVMVVAAFIRAKNPRGESDVPFLIATIALLVVAMLPPPALALSGPLCAPPTLIGAGERIVRAFLFACVYTVLVYCSAPISNTLPDTLVCIARSATASAWILGVVVYVIPLALLQIAIVLYCSFQTNSMLQYENVALNGSDVESCAAQDGVSKERSSPIPIVAAGAAAAMSASVSVAEDEDIVAVAAAHTRNMANLQALHKPSCVQPMAGNGLTFQLNLPGVTGCGSCTSTTHTDEKARMAEIAATIP